MKTWLTSLGPIVLLVSFNGCTNTITDIGSNVTGSAGESTAKGGSTGSGGSTAKDGSTTKGGSTSTRPNVGGSTSTRPNVGGSTSTSPSVGGSTSTSCSGPIARVTWGMDGGSIPPYYPYESPSTLDANGFSNTTRTFGESRTKAFEHSCSTALDCADWAPELEVINTSLASYVNSGASDQLFGLDTRPVDGPVFVITVGKQTLTIGSACDGTPSCTPIPTELSTLKAALIALQKRAMLKCAPECQDSIQPSATTCGMGGSEVWYYDGKSCTSRLNCVCEGSTCPTFFTSEEECRLAYAHCPTHENCRGESINPKNCTSDEFCSYPLHSSAASMCSAADAPGICIVKPRSCSDVTPTSAVCACGDSKVYASACEAGLAGNGVSPLTSCHVSCLKNEDCARFSDYCALNPVSSASPGDGRPSTPICVDNICDCK